MGNIYRAEVLFRHGINPYRPAREVTAEEFNLAIWADLVDLMIQGTKRGRIDTVRDEHLPQAVGRAPREDRHGGEVYVYRRDGRPCYLCGTTVLLADLQGRKLSTGARPANPPSDLTHPWVKWASSAVKRRFRLHLTHGWVKSWGAGVTGVTGWRTPGWPSGRARLMTTHESSTVTTTSP